VLVSAPAQDGYDLYPAHLLSIGHSPPLSSRMGDISDAFPNTVSLRFYVFSPASLSKILRPL